MKACVLRHPAPIESNPLEYTDVPKPSPSGTQVLVRVNACAVCRTDLHVIEGELAAANRQLRRAIRLLALSKPWVSARSSTLLGRASALHGCTPPTARANTAARGKKTFATIQPSPAGPWMAVMPSMRWPKRALFIRFQRASTISKPRRCCARASSDSARCGFPASNERRTVGVVRLRRRGPRRHSSRAALGR